MKELSDGTKVSARSYYFLLDWNDTDNKTFIADHFGKHRLMDLTIEEYSILWLNATTSEYNEFVKEINRSNIN